MKYPFLNTQQGGIQNSHRNSRLIRHGNSFMENGCQNFSYVHRSRKHWECKFLKIFATVFLCFIAGECHGSVNIPYWTTSMSYKKYLVFTVYRVLIAGVTSQNETLTHPGSLFSPLVFRNLECGFNPDCPTFDRFYIPIVSQAFYVYLFG